MSKKAIIYHNPRCSKSRNTLKLLTENGIGVTEIRYLETPPTAEKLADLCEKLNITPMELIRTGESLFKELGLSKKDQRTDNEWLTILANNPKLIERPIVEIENKAVLGRPPENVLEII